MFQECLDEVPVGAMDSMVGALSMKNLRNLCGVRKILDTKAYYDGRLINFDYYLSDNSKSLLLTPQVGHAKIHGLEEFKLLSNMQKINSVFGESRVLALIHPQSYL